MTWIVALVACPRATGSVSPASDSPVVRLPAGKDFSVSMEDGHCLKLPGPFDEEVSVPERVGQIGAWTAREHLLCFLSEDAETNEASFTVSPVTPPATAKGEFGFGRGVTVDLRPRVETSAVWPLQADVPSLRMPFRGQASRLVALHVNEGDENVDLPIVAARSRFQWAIDVQLVNESLGTCDVVRIPGARRMACRISPDASDAVELVVFCSSEYTHSTTSPWLGLTAPAPAKVHQWALVVTDEKERFEFVVALAKQGADVAWKESTAQRRFRLVGYILTQATMVAVVAAIVACAAAVTGRPAAPLAAVPGLSAAAAALPFLARLAARQDGPSLLQSAFGPLGFLAASDDHTLLGVLAVLLFTMTAHCAAAVQFLAANGNGAAEHMPHGLSFGSWELRSLPFLAMPASAAATSIVLAAWDEGFSRFFNILHGLFGASTLLLLVVVAIRVMRKLREWFVELQVICIQHPKSGQLQFVDRVCDQLCALPFVPGESRLLGAWPSSPSWRFSPVVASILEVEHQGAAKTRGGQPWDATWSAGPWSDFLARQPSSPQLQESFSSSTLRHRGFSVDSAGGLSNPLMQPSGGSRNYKSEVPPSPLLGNHPVVVRTKFVYADSGNDFSIAGVAGLPWLDAAVPAPALPAIEDCLTRVQLRVQAVQLSGPLTGGALSACFDVSDRIPWRFAYDLLAKVALGILAATAPDASIERRTQQAVWMLCLIMATAWVPWTVPHVHFLDNLGNLAAAVAIPLGSGFYFSGQQLLDVADVLAAATLAAAFFPVLLALTAAARTLIAAFVPVNADDFRDEALRQVAAGWGELSGARIGSATSGYQTLPEEDDSPTGTGVAVAPAEAAAVHAADVVLLPPQRTDAESAKVLRARLPCEVKSPILQTHLWMKGPIGVSATLDDRRPQLAIPAELLLGTPELGAMGFSTACPLATVLTPDDGIMLYADEDLNGGVKWPQALQKFLGDQSALLKEARKTLRCLEDRDAQDAPELLVLEILE